MGSIFTTRSRAATAPRVDAAGLLYDVARICNRRTGATDVGRVLLRRLCHGGPWSAGRLLAADGGRLAEPLASHTHLPEPLSAAFNRDATPIADEVFARGRAYASVSRGGLTYGCAIVSDGDAPLGVLMLASEGSGTPPIEWRRAVESVALQVGAMLRRRQLDASIADAVLAEQERIGRDLHDTVSGDLTGLALQADTLAMRLRQRGDGEADVAEQIATDARDAARRLRGVVSGLLPLDFDGDLCSALGRLAAKAAADARLTCVVDLEAACLPDYAARQLYLIAQEAIRNAARHADPAVIRISLRRIGPHAVLEVQDDGGGFDCGPGAGGGCGLAIMKHRAAMIDAGITLTSAAGRGTTVRCEVAAARGGAHS